MDVINKLYSSVSSTVSQLSGVLPGNPVTREYEATQFIASAGPGLLWKIYKGYKKSTKQEASIFVFEKRYLDRWSKADRDIMLETLKRGVTQLTKLRHPQILTVQHGLEESRESLAFATEPVYASLANALGNLENMPQPLPAHLSNYKLYDLEIKYGLMQIIEGLTFLHNDVKLLHHNICPESIIINQQGAWKIFGFDFCISNQSQTGQEPSWPFAEYCQAMHPLTQPSLDYLAPEYILTASHSAASDIYSLGALIYCLYSPNHQSFSSLANDYSKFKRFANELKQLQNTKLLSIDEALRDYVKLMLNTTPELRPDPHQLLKITYFDDIGVKTLNYLDSLFQWDNLQKSQFYKGLPEIIAKMPHRIAVHRVLPSLTKEFVNHQMVPFVLPNVLLIAENSTKDEYITHILPVLKPVMTIQEPIQILHIFMQKMELLLKLTPGEEVKKDILPMLYRALEADAQQIQELCLSVLPTFASLIDYPAMKNALLPRIKKLCINTSYISVRVNCLICLGKLLEHLDKWLVLDEVIPFLPQIPSREPAVLMGILGIYKLAMSHKKLGITKEILATKVLPFLIPLCVENGLTLTQFNALITLVKSMLTIVETEHKAKLEQLNSIKTDSKTFEPTLPSQDTLIAAPKPQNDVEKMLSGLGLDDFGSQPANTTNSRTEKSQFSFGDSSLSIEDKQRLAQQKETAQRLSKQPTPQAVLSQQTPKPSKPLDLTNSLLQSNLNQITSPPKPSYSNTGLSNTQTIGQGFSATSNWTSPPALPAPNNWTSPPALNSWTSPPALPAPNSWSNNTWSYSNQKSDWSAFDSLLPGTNPNSKVPMNQMTSPLLSPQSGSRDNPNTGIKQLSKNDLMDFLG